MPTASLRLQNNTSRYRKACPPMSLTDLEAFERLCTESGIVDAYYDIRGVHHVASIDARRALLGAMHLPADSDVQVSVGLADIERRQWQTVLAPVAAFRESDAAWEIGLTLSEAQLGEPLQWQIHLEDGGIRSGSWQIDAGAALDEIEFDGQRMRRFTAALPTDIGPGYHRLCLQANAEKFESLLIVAPPTCYLPDAIETGARPWGISLQLYAVRSQRNWGIGDFTDLKAAVEILAPLGIAVIGLNPLHALFPHLPENASPYSPSSRDFVNPIYLDIEAIAEYDGCAELRELLRDAAFQSRLGALRAQPRVDYSGVWAVKLEALEILYHQFRQALLDSGSNRARRFRAFQAARGDALYKFALFEALQAYFHDQDSRLETWQQWPEEFRKPGSAAVADWADVHRADIEFHEYLQWQSDEQLASVQQGCERLGMLIGIYNDLAVGNERFSAQCWADQTQYALQTGIGAPPDDFSPKGQNWGLPPQIPRQLQAIAYEPFIRSLRANMRHAGALRIDHVMGLMRLYWVPAGCAADQGTYVRYPFDDLLAIVALESHRNRCLVIGEDLGTVPDEVRHALWVNKILSYRILLFEKDWHSGVFRAPEDYPPLALCASGSHDLPTLRGYWNGADLDLRDTLDLYPSAEIAHQQRHQRQRDRVEILAALARESLVTSADEYESSTELSMELLLATQRFLARTPTCLMTVSLEDLLRQTLQVNLPGTIAQYPNWRHKITLPLEDWITDGDIECSARVIREERLAPDQL
jgi:(1->4)-alpha-D-glucan 1-alpha-D-glucosylmutase